MIYSVRIQPAALADAEEFVAFIRDQKLEPQAATRWFDGLTEAILSLDTMPMRSPVIPEQKNFDIELRHHDFHSHRIVFHIDENERIVHVHDKRPPCEATAKPEQAQ